MVPTVNRLLSYLNGIFPISTGLGNISVTSLWLFLKDLVHLQSTDSYKECTMKYYLFARSGSILPSKILIFTKSD